MPARPPRQFPIPKLSLVQIVSISAIEKFGTLACAAQHLHITPSAITHRIREAEKRLDTQIITHHGNQIILTKAGLHIASLSKKVVSELLRIETEIDQMKESSLRIGITSEDMFQWLMNLPQVKSRANNFKLYVSSIDVSAAIDAILNREIDILLSTSFIPGQEIECHPILTDTLQVIVPPSDPWYRWNNITIADLNDRFDVTATDLDDMVCSGRCCLLIQEIGLCYSYSSPLVDSLVDIISNEGGVGIAFSSASHSYVDYRNIRTIEIENSKYKRNWIMIRNRKNCSDLGVKFFDSIVGTG